MQTNRRNLLKTGAAICILPRPLFAARAGAPKNFLQIIYRDGMHHGYMFDSRPKSMTGAGFFVNQTYSSENSNSPFNKLDAISMQGKIGTQGWGHPLTQALYTDFFATGKMSILNGVYLGNNASHEANLQKMLSGFLQSQVRRPISDLWDPINALSNRTDQFSGGAAGLPLLDFGKYIELLAREEKIPLREKMREAIRLSNSENDKAYLAALKDSEKVGEILKKNKKDAQESFAEGDEFAAVTAATSAIFSLGIARSVAIVINPGLDNHTATPNETASYVDIAGHMHSLLKHFTTTKDLAGRFLLDDTLVMFSSEFNRTMHSEDARGSFDDGTDHNPAGNSIVLAGAGINGGNVFGQTDKREVVDAQGKPLKSIPTQGQNGFGVSRQPGSKLKSQLATVAGVDTHRSAIGMPIDFQTGVQKDFAGEVKAHQLLSYETVVNTLCEIFGPKNSNVKMLADGEEAPVLRALIKNA